jgi:hypothetical protein
MQDEDEDEPEQTRAPRALVREDARPVEVPPEAPAAGDAAPGEVVGARRAPVAPAREPEPRALPAAEDRAPPAPEARQEVIDAAPPARPRPAAPRRVPTADGVPLGDAAALRTRAEAAARGELDQPKPDAGEETRVDRPAVKREAPSAAKEPWQMTRDEWHRELTAKDPQYVGWDGGAKRGNANPTLDRIAHKRRLRMELPDHPREPGELSGQPAGHRDVIEHALKQGRPVPSEVLAEYPDLAKATAPAKPQPSKSEAVAADVNAKLAAKQAKRAARAPDEATDQRAGAEAFKRGENAPAETERSPAWWKGWNEASSADAPLFAPDRVPGEEHDGSPSSESGQADERGAAGGGSRRHERDATTVPADDTEGSGAGRVPGKRQAADVVTPAADEPLHMPDAKEGIESLIRWALTEREKAISDLRARAERGGPLAEEYQRDLAEHEAVDPEALAKDMREFPQHYLRLMSERGGSMSAVGVYRNRVNMPPQEPRVQPAPMPLEEGQAPDLRGSLRDLRENLKKAAPARRRSTSTAGRCPTRPAAQFEKRTGAIVTRYHNDLDPSRTRSAIGRLETYELLPDKADGETRAELARFAVHGSPAKGETAQREGMAEFLRAWMVNPGDGRGARAAVRDADA